MSTMQQVFLAILVAVVACGFAFPIDEKYPWLNPDYVGEELDDNNLSEDANNNRFLSTDWVLDGDMMLQPSQLRSLGRTDESNFWPDGVLYYEFHPSLTNNERSVIMSAINEYHTKTCMRLEERTNQDNYVEFGKWAPDKCFSEIGMIGKRQQLNLGVSAGCFYHGTVVHELMHAFGFWHQHADPKRDDYVTIIWENVIDDAYHLSQFQKYGTSELTDAVGYDYGSIMHYPRNAFSSNGGDTIVPKDPTAEIGQQFGLSEKDIKKLHLMYRKKNC